MVAVFCVLALFGCGARPSSRSEVTLETLRRRAAQSPADMIARRDWALAELVAPGGDLALAARELEALRARAGCDVRVRFGLGLIALGRGSFRLAAEHFAAALDAARESRDPLAGRIAAVSVDKLVALRGDFAGFEQVFRPAIDSVARDPGALGAATTVHVLDLGVRWARERGAREDEARWIRAAGCVTEWTVAGPFGPYPMLRFDETLPPEAPGPLAAEYDLGPDRGRRPTWTVRARGCATNLGRGWTDTGVFYAATDVVVPRDVDAVLTVESPNVFAVLVDGMTVATLDGRTRPTGTALSVPLALAAGRHTLRVKIASRFFNPLLIAALTDPSGRPLGVFEIARGGAHERQPVAHPAEPDLLDEVSNARWEPFARYVAAEYAFSLHHPVAAREALRPLAESPRAAPLTLIAWAAISVADPFTPRGVGRDRARRALEAARERDAGLYYPALGLARLAADDERDDEALRLLRDANDRFADNPEVMSELATRLMDREWDGEARDLFERAAARLPGVCWPQRGLLALAQRHASGALEGELAARVRACDALTDLGALTAVRRRLWGEAIAEYRRLLDLDPEGRAYRQAIVDTQRQRGDLAEAMRGARAILDENPESASLRLDVADMELAMGRTNEAQALLDHELARAPGRMADLFRYRAALARREELAAWRLDGREVLRAFRASGRHYDAGAVLVLDYTVRRVFADGSGLELTHNIVHLQSQEGVDDHAQLNLPEGAVVLTLRTHKADGRVLEPDAIARLDAIAYPDVHIDDAIEFEYVRAIPPPDAAPGGFDTERFYFRGFDEPYDRSEFVVVVPRELASRTRVDVRGRPPTLERRELGGALVEYRWSARQSDRMVAEPDSVSAREYLPSVQVGANVTWSNYVDYLRDRLADLDPYDPAAARLAREVTAGARAASERLRRLHRWVTERIEESDGGTPFASAPVMVAARAGHRARVLCYLLRLEQVPCQIALVRQAGGDATVTDYADAETYQAIVLRARTEQGDIWVYPSQRGAPLGWLPPALAGQEALVLERGAPRVRMPPFDPRAHGQQLNLHVALEPDGSGRVDVVERKRGSFAVEWRDALRHVDAANLERVFEEFVGRQVTAASLVSLRIEGQDEPDADLVLRYTFTAPNLASAVANGLIFEGIYHADLGARYARVPVRTTTQYNSAPNDETQDVVVDLPAGARVADLPADAQGRGPGVRWAIHYERTERGFRVRREVNVPPGRVTAEDYPRFAVQVRALDEADHRRVTIRTR